MKPILDILKKAIEELPDCHEKVVILVMAGNLACHTTNEPLSDFARQIARQILKDTES